MEKLADRLAKALKQKDGLTQAGLARACRVKAPSISDWFNGKTKSIEASNLVNAAEYLGVRAKWLATGLGPMALEDSRQVLKPIANEEATPYIANQSIESSVETLRQALIGVDALTRAQAKPIIDALFADPENSHDLGSRMAKTLEGHSLGSDKKKEVA